MTHEMGDRKTWGVDLDQSRAGYKEYCDILFNYIDKVTADLLLEPQWQIIIV